MKLLLFQPKNVCIVYFFGIRTRIAPPDTEDIGEHFFGSQHLQDYLTTQSVPKLPSGLPTPIFSANHQRLFKNRPHRVFPKGPKMTVLEWIEAAFTDSVKNAVRRGDWPVPRHLPSYKRMGLYKHFPLFGTVERDCLQLQTVDHLLDVLGELPPLIEEIESESEDREPKQDAVDALAQLGATNLDMVLNQDSDHPLRQIYLDRVRTILAKITDCKVRHDLIQRAGAQVRLKS